MLKRESSERRWGGLRRATALCVATSVLAACGDLLEVELPTQVPAETLDNPALAAVLVQGAIADFECALTNYVAATGLLTDELIDATGWIAVTTWDQRRVFPNNDNLGAGNCTVLGYGVYTPLQTARFQAEDVYRRVTEAKAEIPNRETLLATTAAYAGYAYTLLGEGFCEIAVDGGPAIKPAEVLAKAEQWFTTALKHAEVARAQEIMNMARVGRARVRLDLNKPTEAAADARLVPQGFVRIATRSGVNERRWNRVAVDFHRNFFLSVHPQFRDLKIDGVADSRVPVVNANRRGHDGVTPVFSQAKYQSEGDGIPIASWREAQLIIAEAEGGQAAVDAINRLRAAARLPAFSGSDPQAIRAQVLEERRRELFLEGHRLNDMLRHKLPWEEGTTHKGVAFGPTKCLPLPDVERLNNPNIKS